MTTEEIRTQCYKGVFHEVLPNFYNVLASLLFLLLNMTGHLPGSTNTASTTITLLTLGLIIFLFTSVLLWYLSRVKAGMDAWKKEFELSRSAEAQLADVLGGWLRIRDGNGMLSETAATIGEYWDYLRSGVYVMWYHRFYTSWVYTFVRTFAVYTTWVLAPFFEHASDFAPLVTVLGSLGTSLQVIRHPPSAISHQPSAISQHLRWHG